VLGDICAICCGTEREVTVDCPLDCVYLQEARKHEKPRDLKQEEMPHPDIAVTDNLIERNTALVSFVGRRLAQAAGEIAGLTDFDIREALDAVIRTLRTQQSGLYYETRPQNPVAGSLYLLLQAAVTEFRQAEQQQLGISRTRDSDVLGTVVFFRRAEYVSNNGRRRGRAYIDFLHENFPPASQTAKRPSSSLIIP
jgi:hypothetical protein